MLHNYFRTLARSIGRGLLYGLLDRFAVFLFLGALGGGAAVSVGEAVLGGGAGASEVVTGALTGFPAALLVTVSVIWVGPSRPGKPRSANSRCCPQSAN